MENRKISVAFFLPTLEVGGTEKNVVNLANGLDKKSYQASVVLGMLKGDFVSQVHQDIPLVDLKAPQSLGLFFALMRYFKTQKPDIFVSAFPRINVISLAAKMFSKSPVKIVITEHSVFSLLPVIAKTSWRAFIARFFMPGLAKFFYPKAAAIVAVSKGIKKDLLIVVNNALNIKLIYNPVIDDHMLELAKEPVNHPWFAQHEIPVILAAGRLVAIKDYPTMLSAFSLVLKTCPAYLVVLGRGPEQEKLEVLAKKLGISNNIAFLGFKENPYKYMAKAKVFVLSSLQEGFGNVIIEAMASGTPVISTDCPTGPEEIIEHGKNGLLTPMGDSQNLAGAIIKIINSPELARQLSIQGRLRAEFFSVQKSVKEYENIFKNITTNKI